MNIVKNLNIGIDISDQTIEVIALQKVKNNIEIVGKNRITLPSGVVSNGLIKKQDELSKIVNKLLTQAKPQPITGKSVTISLPDSQVYIHVFNAPEVKKVDLEDLIEEEIVKIIPIPISELNYNYNIIDVGKNVKRIIVSAVSRAVLQEWSDFFKNKLKLNINSFEIEAIAMRRDLFKEPLTKSVLLVDIGSVTTNLSVFDKFGLGYVQNIFIAGNNITNAIGTLVKNDLNKAEELKIKKGLNISKKNVKLAMHQVIDELFAEITKAKNFYEKLSKKKIDRVVFLGGSANLPGLYEYFQESTKLKATLGRSQLLKSDNGTYIEAVGLALRELSNQWSKHDPKIDFYTKKRKRDKKIKKSKPKAIDYVIKSNDKSGEISPRDQAKQKKQVLLFIAIVVIGIVLIGIMWNFKKQKNISESDAARQQAMELLEGIPAGDDQTEQDNLPIEDATIDNTNPDVINYIEQIDKEDKVQTEEKPVEEEVVEPVEVEPQEEKPIDLSDFF